MATYRVTADATYTSISVEVDALNPDDAWEIAKEKHGGNLLYNGKVEELPTRSELLARIQELETAGREIYQLMTEDGDKAWIVANPNRYGSHRKIARIITLLAALLNNTPLEKE